MSRTNNAYLLEESLGRQWYFFVNDQQLIEYSLKEDKTWTKPAQVDSQSIRRFSVTIDRNDNIHLLAYTTSKQLLYYMWKGDQWYQRLLLPISSRFENISFLELISTRYHIHLFYYIENSLKRAQESLIHSYLKDGKWTSDVLLNFLTDQVVTPQLIRSDDKGNIFCVYTRRIQNQTRCYCIYYDINDNAWTKPSILFQKPGSCYEFNGQTDSTGNLHLVWVEEVGSDYRLNYKSINPNDKYTTSETICIQEGVEQVQSPSIHIGSKLYCFWVQDGRGFASQGDTYGLNWEIPQVITKGPVIKYVKINKTLDGIANTLSQLGDGYPGFEWTLETMLLGNKSKPAEKKLIEQVDDKYEKIEKSSLSQVLEKTRQRIDKLESQIYEVQNNLDEIYTALHGLQDYIRQKDKASFQREAQLHRLSFELEQLRSMKSRIPSTKALKPDNENTAEPDPLQETKLIQQIDKDEGKHDLLNTGSSSESSINVEEKQEQRHIPREELPEEGLKYPLPNIDTGSGEIHLGGVSILINPEDESD